MPRVRRRSARRRQPTAHQHCLLSVCDIDASSSDAEILGWLGDHIPQHFESVVHIRECLIYLGKQGDGKRKAKVVEFAKST